VSTKKTLNINVPVLARVEGEGALDLHIKEGNISGLRLRIFEPPRFFEKFLEGRSYSDLVDTVARICGICPVAYQMSAVQALEGLFGTQVTSWVNSMRRVMYCGEWLQSHSLHIHMLAAPDFLGVNSIFEMARDNNEAVLRGLRLQSLGNDLIALFGARSVHPVGVCVGGFTRAPDAANVSDMVQRLADAKQDAEELVQWVTSLGLPNDEQDFCSVSLRHSQHYPIDGGRIISDQGLDIGIDDFEQHFAEHQVPHSTALHALLQGEPYLVGPLARLNLNLDRLPPDSRKLLDDTGIEFPSRNMFHSVIARAIEIHYVVGEAHRLLQDYLQNDSQDQSHPGQTVSEMKPVGGIGFGCTEAPRGMLWHRYELDNQGIIKAARIVPPTSQNQGRIEQDLMQSLLNVGLDNPQEMLRLHAEKVIRNYDPCISCATHFLKLSINDSCLQQGKYGINQSQLEQKERNKKLDTDTFNSTVVIGIGSPYGNDSLGREVIQRLQQDKKLKQNPAVKLIYLDRPGFRLLDFIQPDDRVILVDAVSSSQAPGSLVRLGLDDIKPQEKQISTHNVGLADTLQTGRILLQLPKLGLLLGLETGGQLDRCFTDPELKRLVDAVYREIGQNF
jgi:sulfhydrogenase subunit alpha